MLLVPSAVLGVTSPTPCLARRTNGRWRRQGPSEGVELHCCCGPACRGPGAGASSSSASRAKKSSWSIPCCSVSIPLLATALLLFMSQWKCLLLQPSRTNCAWEKCTVSTLARYGEAEFYLFGQQAKRRRRIYLNRQRSSSGPSLASGGRQS